MAIGVHPPADQGDTPSAKRHPRAVHDEMEAIFGVPSSLKPARRNFTPNLNTLPLPDLEFERRMGSTRLWIALAVLAVVMIGGFFLIWGLFGAAAPRPTEPAAIAQAQPALPSPDGLPAEVTRATNTPPCAGTIDADGRCVTPPPVQVAALPVPAPAPPVPVAAQRVVPLPPQPLPVKTAPADAVPVAKTDGTTPNAQAPDQAALAPPVRGGPCYGTSYQNMAKCPPKSVLKADSALSSAYTSAISANVDPARLAPFSQRWSELRENAASDPEATADEFANLTSELNALIVAQSHRKP